MSHKTETRTKFRDLLFLQSYIHQRPASNSLEYCWTNPLLPPHPPQTLNQLHIKEFMVTQKQKMIVYVSTPQNSFLTPPINRFTLNRFLPILKILTLLIPIFNTNTSTNTDTDVFILKKLLTNTNFIHFTDTDFATFS